MPYDPDRFYIPETLEEVQRGLLEIINEYEDKTYTLSEYIGTNRYVADYPFIEGIYNFGIALSALPANIQSFIMTKNETNLVATTTTTIGIETSLQQMVDSGLLTDYAFGTFQDADSGLPAGNIGFALTIRDDLDTTKLEVANKIFSIIAAPDKVFTDGAVETFTVVSPLGRATAIVGWFDINIIELKIQIIAVLAGDNSLKLSNTDIVNTILDNFKFNTTGIFVNRLKEGLNGFEKLHIRVSVDGGTTWITEDTYIPRDFKTRFALQAGDISIVESFDPTPPPQDIV